MREYYIFQIKDDVYKSTKNKTVDLFLSLNKIYKMDTSQANEGLEIFKTIAYKFDKRKISKLINEVNEDNINYTCFKHNHLINDYIVDENTKLSVFNTYLHVKSNSCIPSFFMDLKSLNNLFVVDFKNLDYFYLSEVFNNQAVNQL